MIFFFGNYYINDFSFHITDRWLGWGGEQSLSIINSGGTIVLPSGTIVLPGGTIVLPSGTIVLPLETDNLSASSFSLISYT